jgi:hypothetical protein
VILWRGNEYRLSDQHSYLSILTVPNPPLEAPNRLAAFLKRRHSTNRENTMAYVCTRFEGDTEEAKWDGWENGPGALKGELKTEGDHGYWSGQVNMFNMQKVQPALRKVFDVEPGTGLYFHFHYRIQARRLSFFT